MPDYFRVEFDAEQTAVEARLTFSYGRAHDDVYGSVPIGDDFYYAVDDGTQITVANANPSDTGFVYICCDIAHPRDALVGYTGESISVPGGYFVDVDEDMYYLGADGQWERSVYGVLLVGQVMGTDGAMGTMLRSGESCTFTLPKDGMDGAYLLYFYYFDPAQDNLSDNYTEYQRNVFQYRDGFRPAVWPGSPMCTRATTTPRRWPGPKSTMSPGGPLQLPLPPGRLCGATRR